MLDVLQDMKKGRMAQTAPAVKAPDSNAGTATKTSKKQRAAAAAAAAAATAQPDSNTPVAPDDWRDRGKNKFFLNLEKRGELPLEVCKYLEDWGD